MSADFTILVFGQLNNPKIVLRKKDLWRAVQLSVNSALNNGSIEQIFWKMFNDCLPFSSVLMQYQKEVQKMENESFKTSHRHNRGWKKLAEKRLERSLKQLFLNLVLKVQRLQLALQSIYCANISKYLSLSTFKMFDGFASRKNRYIKVSSREYRIGSTGNFYLLRG